MRKTKKLYTESNFNMSNYQRVGKSLESDFFSESASLNNSNQKPFNPEQVSIDDIRKTIIQIKGVSLDKGEPQQPINFGLGVYQ